MQFIVSLKQTTGDLGEPGFCVDAASLTEESIVSEDEVGAAAPAPDRSCE